MSLLNNSVNSSPKTFTEGEEMRAALKALGESVGEFKPYDSQLDIPEIKGTRIVKCLYQTNKSTGKKIAENSYVRIPTKHLTEEHIVSRIAELSPYVLTWLQELENTAIRDLHKKGALNVYPDSLSLDKIIESLEAAQAGARLNKEKIEAWFTDEIADSLTVLFAAKMGLDENAAEHELEKLELIVNAYKAKFASLASGKVFIKEDDCKAMIKVIKECEKENTLLGARFISRLEKMSEKKEDLLLAL